MGVGPDVVIENLRTGTMARYGLAMRTEAHQPGIIFCSVTRLRQPAQGREPGRGRRHPGGQRPDEHHRHAGVRPDANRLLRHDYVTGYAAAFTIAGRCSTAAAPAKDRLSTWRCSKSP